MHILSLGNCWDNISHCVICWSEPMIDIKSVEVVYERVIDRFPDVSLTTVVLPGMIASPPDYSMKIENIREEEFVFWGFPSKRLKSKLKRLNADIAIDLSLRYNPLSAYVSLLSGARIRIGFAIPNAGYAFNYQVAPTDVHLGKSSYSVLAKYIG